MKCRESSKITNFQTPPLTFKQNLFAPPTLCQSSQHKKEIGIVFPVTKNFKIVYFLLYENCNSCNFPNCHQDLLPDTLNIYITLLRKSKSSNINSLFDLVTYKC